MRHVFSALLVLVLAGAVAAQGTIRGTVLDAASGETVPAASLLVQELGRGAASDLDGQFEITEVPAGTYTLVATFLGYSRTTVPVTVRDGDVSVVTVSMAEDRLGLDEVVVTGQGAAVQTRRLSTTVEVITPRQIEAMPATRLDELLQAQLPGAQVRFSSGQPGTASLIRSRGPISAFSSTTPVIYVDGVRVDNLNTAAALGIDTGGAQSSAIPDIPIENVERIEFIKGGAATTLYGSDAANGVIQIFTKRGVSGQTTLTYEGQAGSIVGTRDFLKYDQTADLLYRAGLSQQHRLSGNGGVAGLTYSFAGSLYGDDGFREGNRQEQYGLRTTVGGRVSNALQYAGSFGFTALGFERDVNANNGLATFGSLEGGQEGDLTTLDAGQLAVLGDSIRTLVSLYDYTGDTRRFQTSQQLDLTPGHGLAFKGVIGLDYRASTEEEVQGPAFLTAAGLPPTSSTLIRSQRRFLGLTLEATGQHQGDIGDFSFVSTVGGQVFRDDDRQDALTATNIAEGSTSLNNAADQTAIDFNLVVANYGVYVQENIGYRNRYFVEGGFRADANSAFGDEIGVVGYPKVGLGYVLSSEPFWEGSPILRTVAPYVKLRANLGFAGKFPTPFANDRLVTATPFLGEIAYTYGQFGNPDLRPERVRTIEAGADLALSGGRLGLEVTYFNARTEDALFTVPFVPTSGRGAQLFNVGEILNTGWELAAQAFVLDGRDASLRLNASLNTLSNEVVDNGGTAPFSVGGFTFLGQWIEEGQPVGYLRGDRPTFDAEGNLVDVERDAVLGSPLPDLFGTIGLNARLFGRVDLLVSADYQLGAQGIAVDDVLRFFGGVQDEDRFPTAPDGSIPALSQGSFFDLAGVWVEDTDFLKVRLISLGYDVPPQWFRNPVVRSLSVGVRAVNPFNVVASSFDPEVTGDNGQSGTGGVQNGVNLGVFGFGTESPPRQFLFNLKAGF
ncbi:TonB-dependent receptor domain-containing protein [Rubrivirga sp. IMCC45206]|uniref:TonB-dependent receptor domain-containing protein n=1 Tax=Rubrivirga sp. IMCC45206 TaxID=3391614 RepID=UPI0039900E0B